MTMLHLLLFGAFMSGALLAEDSAPGPFKSTHLEGHHRFNGAASTSSLAEQSAMLLTVEHYSEQSYGDWFLFFDVLGKHSGSYVKASEIYLHIEPRFSLPRTFGAPDAQGILKDYYVVVRYNDADVSYLNRAVLVGLSVDWRVWEPMSLTSTVYLRKEDSQQLAPHFGAVWSASFSLLGGHFTNKGFLDLYRNDADWVLHAQPQLLWDLNDVGLRSLSLGTEQQISNDFFGLQSGWVWLPTLFIKLSL